MKWRAAHGNIWNGWLETVETGFGPLNKVQIQTEGLALLRGRPPVSLQAWGSAFSASGNLGPGSLSDLQIWVDISALPLLDPRFSDLQGQVRVQIKQARFDHACKEIEGQAWTDVLQHPVSGSNWSGPVLSGPVRCRNGGVWVALSGQQANERLQAKLWFQPDGQYRAEISIQSPNPQAEAVLPAFGFVQSPDGYSLIEQGRWAYNKP
jgi:hypothetical protein